MTKNATYCDKHVSSRKCIFLYVPKNKGESSSKENADLKSISVHPNFFAIIKEPFATNEFLDFLPRSLIIKREETPTGYKCSIE